MKKKPLRKKLLHAGFFQRWLREFSSSRVIDREFSADNRLSRMHHSIDLSLSIIIVEEFARASRERRGIFLNRLGRTEHINGNFICIFISGMQNTARRRYQLFVVYVKQVCHWWLISSCFFFPLSRSLRVRVYFSGRALCFSDGEKCVRALYVFCKYCGRYIFLYRQLLRQDDFSRNSMLIRAFSMFFEYNKNTKIIWLIDWNEFDVCRHSG